MLASDEAHLHTDGFSVVSRSGGAVVASICCHAQLLSLSHGISAAAGQHTHHPPHADHSLCQRAFIRQSCGRFRTGSKHSAYKGRGNARTHAQTGSASRPYPRVARGSRGAGEKEEQRQQHPSTGSSDWCQHAAGHSPAVWNADRWPRWRVLRASGRG